MIRKVIKQYLEDRRRLRNAFKAVAEPVKIPSDELPFVTDARLKMFNKLYKPVAVGVSGLYLFVCLLVTIKNLKR